MKMHIFRWLLIASISFSAGCSKQEEATPAPDKTGKAVSATIVADSVYHNGKIYTVNENQSWVEAVAIKDGKFLVVGSDSEVKAVTGEGTEVVDLGGRMAMPGMFDVHSHPLGATEGWANLRIDNPMDPDAMLAQIKAYAASHPELKAIRGETWGLGVFPDDSPRKELLDAIVSDRPVYLLSQTGHSAWVNSTALEMAGITRDTPITESFIYDTDPETGEPSGTVREFAMGAVEQVFPRTTRDVYAPALRDVLSEFNAFGFTSLKPAEGERNWLEGAAHLEAQGGLTMRLFPAWHWRTHYSAAKPEQEDRLIAGWKDFQTDLISPRYVKIFYDGGPDSYTALLLEDYVGRPGFKGQSTRPREELQETIRQFNADGLGVVVHVLGDGGGRELVEIFTEVRKANGDNGVPLHFSHAWMTRPEDIERLSRVKDACIDFSPVLAYPAPEIEGSMVPPIGEARYQKFYNVRSAFESGMPVGFGSDWPSALIPDPNGFHQMQSWITRQNPEDPSSGTLNADQAITLEQAIRGYTLGGAECLGFGWDKKLGSIEAGKLADFIVLDRNLFETPIAELYKAQVDVTLLGGQVVYDRSKDDVDDLIDEEHFAPGTRYSD